MRISVLAAAASFFALNACSPAADEPGHAEAEGAHWSYAEQSSWEGECPTGHQQSPVALPTATPSADLPDLAPAYAAGGGDLINNGHTLQFTPSAPGTTLIGADSYNLLQFHFHGASEHTLDNASFPLELHFVNRNAAGQLAVVGVFIKEGAFNPALASLIAAIPAEAGEAAATHPNVDPAALLPATRLYFAYPGSLTTPPCSEGVRWNVLAMPVEASAEQIDAIRTAIGPSNRATQPLYDRTLSFGG
jgi:carbonic anhydrase